MNKKHGVDDKGLASMSLTLMAQPSNCMHNQVRLPRQGFLLSDPNITVTSNEVHKLQAREICEGNNFKMLLIDY